MRAVGFNELGPDRWDELAASSPEAWLNHRSAWVAIEERFFAGSNLSFALIENGEVVGIQPLYLNDFGCRLGIAFGPNGMTPCPGVSTLNADQLLDLTLDEQALFAGLHESCRNAVRQAERSKLTFEISNDLVHLEAYMEIARG